MKPHFEHQTDTTIDLLSLALESMDVAVNVVGLYRMGSPWQLTVPSGGPLFGALSMGRCRFSCDRAAAALRLSTSDVLLVTHGDPCLFAEGAAGDAYRLEDLAAAGRQEIGRHPPLGGSGSVTELLIGRLSVPAAFCRNLLTALPPVVHLPCRQTNGDAWSPLLIRMLIDEWRQSSPGATAAMKHLVLYLFLRAIRDQMNTQVPGGVGGWLSAANDPHIAQALVCMHQQMDRPWSVETLAIEVGMSRSAFAEHFSRFMGQPPMQYLSQQRMQRAKRLLRSEGLSVKEVAYRVGYATESAFGHAFKRAVGVPPGSYR